MAASKFAVEVEFDVLEVVLCHLEYVGAVGQEYVAALFVACHVLVFAFLEVVEFGFVVAFYPAGFVEAERLPAAFGVVFFFEAVLDDFELELAYCADYFAVVELVGEELGHAFVHELLDAFAELFLLHGVGVFDVFEHEGGETGEAFEVEVFAFGYGVADFEYAACVGEAYDVAGPCFVDGLFALCHELGGGGEADVLAVAYVQVGGVALEFAGAYFAEGDAGAVVGVDVGCYLEDEACEFFFFGFDGSFFCCGGAGGGGDFYEAVEEFFYAEVVEGGAEEDGGEVAGEVFFAVELGVYFLDDFEFVAKAVGEFVADFFVEGVALEVDFYFFCDDLFGGAEEVEAVVVDVVDAFESGA